MRLVYLVNTPQFFLSHWEPLALAARQAGYGVHVVCPDGEAVSAVRSRGWPVHVVRLGRSLGEPLGELDSIGRIALLYRRLRPDVVHHLSLKPVAYGGIAARIAGVPAVAATVTGLGFSFSERRLRAWFARSAATALLRVALKHGNQQLFFENPDDRKLFAELRLSATDNGIVIPGAGVDCATFAPAEEPPGPPLVTLPGRMLWSKGVGDFVEAASILAKRGIRARFALVGGRDPDNPACVPESWLETQTGPVEHWGYRVNMNGVFRQSSIVCLLSSREGMPKVLAEASASGRAVVATDVPGCREAVEDGVTGVLVPRNDPLASAAALERLIRDPALRKQMGRNGRDIALQRFQVGRITETVLSVYSRLLGSPSSLTRKVIPGAPQPLSARLCNTGGDAAF